MTSPQLSAFTLIAFDLPAHGESAEAVAVTDNYSLPGIAYLMTRAITQIANGNNYVVACLSLGTNIVAEMLAFPCKPAGIVLISPCVISKIEDLQNVFLPNPNSDLYFKDEIEPERMKHLMVSSFYKNDETLFDAWAQDFINTKSPFRSLLIKGVMEGKYLDEISLLQNKNFPLLVIYGRNDMLINADYLDHMELNFWKDTVHKLPNARHFVHIDRADPVNQLISEYAAVLFKAIHS